MLFGDSIVAGYGLAEEDSLSVKLQQLLQSDGYEVEVVNGGVSGDTTSSGRSRLEWTVEKHQPDIVVLALGGNDALRGSSPDITKENLDAMLDMLQEREVVTVLTKVNAPLNLGLMYKKKFDGLYSDLANAYDLELRPFLLENTFGKSALMQSDQIHPSAGGVEVIASDLAGYLVEYLEK